MREIKILMIDDHEDDLILFREMLEDAGFIGEVIGFGGVGGARIYLEKMRAEGKLEEVGIIFLDLNMPIVNGFEYLEELRGDGDFRKIPVIMISGSRREIEKEMALEKGAIAYFVKPIGFEAIVSAVQGLPMKWSLS